MDVQFSFAVSLVVYIFLLLVFWRRLFVGCCFELSFNLLAVILFLFVLFIMLWGILTHILLLSHHLLAIRVPLMRTEMFLFAKQMNAS